MTKKKTKKHADPITLHITINSKITIVNYRDIPEALSKKITKLCTKVNPLIAIRKRQGLPYRDLTKNIYMYSYVVDSNESISMHIDRGMWRDLKQVIDNHNKVLELSGKMPIGIAINMSVVTTPVAFPEFKLVLEGYQQTAQVSALSRNQGVLSFPPGGGKTILAASILGQIKQRTLVIVHTEQLAEQWCEALGSKTYDGLHIGKFFGTSKEQGTHVTVATIQSIVNYHNKNEFYTGYGCVILDECHHVPADTFREVVGKCRAKYRYGLTASLKRKDRKEFLMFSIFGSALVQLSYEDIGDRIIMPRVVRVDFDDPGDLNIEDVYAVRKGEMRLEYAYLYGWMADSKGRNSQLKKVLNHLVNDRDAVVLILTKRRDHAQLLQDYLINTCKTTCGLLLGGGSAAYKKKKKLILEDARAGKLKFIVGTSIADEGLDVVTLNRLVLAMPSSFDELLRQRIGRIARNVEGKEIPIVYDLVDTYIPELNNSWAARNRLYKILKMEVSTTGIGDL